jgi:hypothetical protein
MPDVNGLHRISANDGSIDEICALAAQTLDERSDGLNIARIENLMQRFVVEAPPQPSQNTLDYDLFILMKRLDGLSP